MKHKEVFFLCIFFISAIFFAGANDDIKPAGLYFFTEPGGIIPVTYHSDSSNNKVRTITLYLEHKGNENYGMVTFSRGTTVPGYSPRKAIAAGSSDTIDYYLYKPGTTHVLKDLNAPEAQDSTALRNNSLIIDLKDSSNNRWTEYEVSFQITIPKNQFLSSNDTYEDTFTIRLYTRNQLNNLNNVVPHDNPKDVTISINSSGVIKVTLGYPDFTPYLGDSDYRMDLGELDEGTKGSADLFVEATTQYSVWVRSANKGMMVHETVPDAGIPYSLSFMRKPLGSSEQANLTSGNTVPLLGGQIEPATGPDGKRYGIEIIIDAFDKYLKPSGNYKDQLSFTISAE